MELKFLGHPVEKITIDTTNQCNLSCRLCFVEKCRQNSIRLGNKTNFFSYELFAKLCDEINSYTNRDEISIALSGGEPFILPHIEEIIKKAYKERLKFFIFTNGTILSPYFELISICPPPYLIFSIDGVEKEHDANRGAGRFKQTEQAIQKINALKNKLKSKKPHLSVNTIISHLNYDDFLKIITWAEKLDIEDISFSLVQWNDDSILKKIKDELTERYGERKNQIVAFDGLNNAFCRLNEKETKILVKNLNKARVYSENKNRKISIHFFPGFSQPEEYEYWFSRKSFKINFCTNIFSMIRINYNGYVAAGCGVPIFILGNLREDSLNNILNGQKAHAFAADIEKRGYFYACARCCRRPGKSRAIFDIN